METSNTRVHKTEPHETNVAFYANRPGMDWVYSTASGTLMGPFWAV